jgi:plastocyanin
VIRRSFAPVALATLAACGGSGVPASSEGTVTVDVNLTLNSPAGTPYGESAGYAPSITTVAVGSQIRFTNTDSFTHTATLIDATQFPQGSPLEISALMQHGATLSRRFSTGALHPGSSSQTVAADRAGTYLFGCFFHYGAPMRAAIFVQ